MSGNAGPKVQRRLAAIFAADVEGYSRLMGQDEVGTLRTLTGHREIMDRLIGEHEGRIANTAGDSVLAEFPSVVEAVRAAVEIQEALSTANDTVPEDRRVRFRIGVHVGDVMVKGGDLFGDGVNIAARLQAIAEPGEVCISGPAHEHVRKALPLTYHDCGLKQVKNIAEPLRAFAVRPGGRGVHPAAQSASGSSRSLPLPDKPSIAVLPFTNMSGDPEQEYFADGVVEDIITGLSRVKWFFVIARNSSFTYKGKPVDIRQVGRELGVRYVLEGSIRKAGNRVRITGQLIEATTSRHVWADKFDGDLADIFDLQDQITEAVVGATEPSLRAAEVERAYAKPTDDLDAYDLYLRALPHHYAVSKPRSDEALRLLGRALERAPEYSSAKALAAAIYNIRRLQNWADETEVRRGIQLAREAWADHRDDPTTLSRVAVALGNLARDFDAALAAIDRALTLNPNSAMAYGNGGLIRLWMGDWRTAIDYIYKDMRLSPLDPGLGFAATAMCNALLHGNRPEEALGWAHKGLHEMPTLLPALRGLIVALVELDRLDEAREVALRLLAVDSKQTVTLIAQQIPFRDPTFREKYFRAMRAAGIPE
jgi:adenylate cyclase